MVMDEVSFGVDGFPPAKSEALSMLGAGHPHSSRVKKLLEAAQVVMVKLDFHPFTGPIGLEIVLWVPLDNDPWDATNYLGGIADVLQDKKHLKNHRTTRIDHPDELMQVALYQNDRQIREIHYYQESRASPAYRVRIWSLHDV